MRETCNKVRLRASRLPSGLCEPLCEPLVDQGNHSQKKEHELGWEDSGWATQRVTGFSSPRPGEVGGGRGHSQRTLGFGVLVRGPAPQTPASPAATPDLPPASCRGNVNTPPE